jgi:Na+-transporting NADH:ubiquinone oxidoreductase subunit NqrA
MMNKVTNLKSKEKRHQANCWGSFLKKILEFFSCKASVFNNLFEKAFSNINTRMNRNGNSFICCGVYECEMTSPLAIFSKASTFKARTSSLAVRTGILGLMKVVQLRFPLHVLFFLPVEFFWNV